MRVASKVGKRVIRTQTCIMSQQPMYFPAFQTPVKSDDEWFSEGHERDSTATGDAALSRGQGCRGSTAVGTAPRGQCLADVPSRRVHPGKESP